MEKSPEEIQQSVSELIQEHEARKSEKEALAEKYKKAHVEKLKIGYVPTTLNDWDIPIEEKADTMRQTRHVQSAEKCDWSQG